MFLVNEDQMRHIQDPKPITRVPFPPPSRAHLDGLAFPLQGTLDEMNSILQDPNLPPAEKIRMHADALDQIS